MASAGLGPLGIIKSESAQVAVGTLGITLAGLLLGKVWFMSVAHKQPRTFTPQWKAAEAKYRAMQKQDPIRNM